MTTEKIKTQNKTINHSVESKNKPDQLNQESVLNDATHASIWSLIIGQLDIFFAGRLKLDLA